jgi:hypothetical protein
VRAQERIMMLQSERKKVRLIMKEELVRVPPSLRVSSTRL